MQLLGLQGSLQQTRCQSGADHLVGVMADHHPAAMSRSPHLRAGMDQLQLVADQLQLSGADFSGAVEPEPMG